MKSELTFRQFITDLLKQLDHNTGSIVDPFAISQPFFGSTFNLPDDMMIKITEEAALAIGLRPLMT